MTDEEIDQEIKEIWGDIRKWLYGRPGFTDSPQDEKPDSSKAAGPSPSL